MEGLFARLWARLRSTSKRMRWYHGSNRNGKSFGSVQSLNHVWLCDPMDCSTPGFPVHHQLLELAQTHVHHYHLNYCPIAMVSDNHKLRDSMTAQMHHHLWMVEVSPATTEVSSKLSFCWILLRENMLFAFQVSRGFLHFLASVPLPSSKLAITSVQPVFFLTCPVLALNSDLQEPLR